MKNRVFILNGAPTAGKDTFAEFMIDKFKEYGLSAYISSSIDSVKQAALYLGWDGKKNEHGRNALSALKDFATLWWDGPYREMCDHIDDINEDEVIIFTIREPNEIDRMVQKYPDIITIFVDRYNVINHTNHADKNVSLYNYVWYIENNSTLNDLKESADKLIEHLYGAGNE